MSSKMFDLNGAISDLLMRIDEGRRIVSETQGVSDDFDRTCAKRDLALQHYQNLQLRVASLEEPLRSPAQAEADRQRSEYKKLNDESDRLCLRFRESIAFIDPFCRDLSVLLERLPLKPEWKVFRQAVASLPVGHRGAWTDPPANSALDTLEMRLREMLDLAGRPQLGQVPGSHVSRRSRGPNLELSRQRIELEEKLRSELATVAIELLQMPSLNELRRKFPEFQIWQLLSDPEQESLLTEPFKPRAYAQVIVLRRFGLTSQESLKKDRRKLKGAAKKHPAG